MSSVKSVRYRKIAEVFRILWNTGLIVLGVLVLYFVWFALPEQGEEEKTECLCVCGGGPDEP